MRGKANPTARRLNNFEDHPRLCGEKLRLVYGRLCVNKDHPRLCGEKLLLCEHCGKPIGSPPPMRGKAQMSP